VQLLHEVKELGQRPEATPEAWAVPLRSRGPIFGGVDATAEHVDRRARRRER
jgi:hypothetical protein